MKILIIENEVYLAQSIATKLGELGHNCEMCTSTKDAIRGQNYDVVLLSTNINGQDFNPVIETFKHSIVILMVSYISNDTVSKPLAAGAKDYILKPFMIEELIRKLQHLDTFNKLQKDNNTYRAYVKNLCNTSNLNLMNSKIKFPILIKSNLQKDADAMVFKYSVEKSESFTFISLESKNCIEKITRTKYNELLYLVDFQNLKKNEKTKILNLIENKKAIISTTDLNETCKQLSQIEVPFECKTFDNGDILCIDDYVKQIIINFQNKFPDTELSKRLGISRKSLWEKRKKYGIQKKK